LDRFNVQQLGWFSQLSRIRTVIKSEMPPDFKRTPHGEQHPQLSRNTVSWAEALSQFKKPLKAVYCLAQPRFIHEPS
jgi:hypothetical protein